MFMRALLLRVVGLSAILSLAFAHAEPPVPAPLEAWRPWVMHGQEFRACPLLAGKDGKTADEYLCAWPGVLDIRADANGAAISERWRVEAESWVPLPGTDYEWPQQVTVDGQPAPVVNREGPALRLAPGTHDVRARFEWRTRPETLHVPAAVGIVALEVDGKSVVPVQHRGDEVTLGRGSSAAPEADNVEVHVFRKLADGIPALLTTDIQLAVSGQAREEVLGPVLPAGFEPLTLESPWPARIDGDGKLHVQVDTGDATITLEARATAPLAKVVARVPDAPWPSQEIWSYEAAPTLRVTTATSALQVDPRQAFVKDEWQMLPAFALGDGATLAIDERSRGLAPDEKNRLTLDREMWLDFAGDGWFARDRIGGEMLRGWRFEVLPPFALERADAQNIANPGSGGERLLVTRGSAHDATGVEWRTPNVALAAGVRIASAASSLPVTGWQDSFDRVTTQVHLPSGYKLLAAPGADSAAGSWISRWTLLDVFVAAIIALLAWRLFGAIGGGIAIAYLVLGYQESGAPLWTLLAALALGLIARALPAGKLATTTTWLRRAALVLLVLVALPFVAEQLRFALHPQLENGGGLSFDDGLVGGIAMKRVVMQEESKPTDMESPPPPASAPMPQEADKADRKLETITVTGSNIRRVDVMEHYNASTIVQTGAGEPGWNVGERYLLSWSGPVLAAQTVRLVIAPPWLVRVLRIALVALLAALIVRAVRGRMDFRRAVPVVAAIVLSSFTMTSPAQAQAFPPQDLLDQLRASLVEPPPCAPQCASIAKADVSARGDEIRVALEAHAASRAGLPVPGDSDVLALRSITVDGVAQDGLARNAGMLEIGLARGVHRVELVYTATGDKALIHFPLQPKRIELAVDGWQSGGGIADDRLLTETLSLTRTRENASTSVAGGQQFAPFVHVTREIMLGSDWSISTSVARLAPKDGGFTVSVPVLAGEHVSSPGIKVENGRIAAAIPDQQLGTSWNGTLEKGETLTLTAPALTDRAETWRITANPMWHVEASGVPVSVDANATDRTDYKRFEFAPLPGETLTLHITRPEAAEGSTRAIDRVTIVTTAAQRASDTVLDLSMRASQGGEQAITLPADAEVMNVRRNGEALNVRPRIENASAPDIGDSQRNVLSLPVVPGLQQFEIRFREPASASFVGRTPAVSLGLPAANVNLGVDIPADRWLLATGGPAEGPAVLYWSELAVMLLVAYALARARRTPLTLMQWILLGIGFSTFSWLALTFVVAWLFALDWRARGPAPSSATWFDLAQIALAALTLIALVALAAAIPQGLLGSPDMHVAGNGSNAQSLRWFVDRSDGALPDARAISVPLWVYKIAMLAWALWLANAVIGWLRYGFAAWSNGGYWRALRKSVVDVPAATAPPA
jgi:hypothetical protein